MRKLLLLCLLAPVKNLCWANIKLPKLISDSMVLQRETPLQLWGWAEKDERVTLTFKGIKYRATLPDSAGRWRVVLPPQKAGGPFSLKFTGRNVVEVKGVVFGDVWFFSGQSNMVHQMYLHDVTYEADIKNANFPLIRQFTVPNSPQLSRPLSDFAGGSWQAAVGEQVRPFSAVAYFFARKIFQQYGVPVGIINASVGGTPIEAWMSEKALRPFEEPYAILQKLKDTAYVMQVNQKAAAAAKARQLPPPDAGLTEPKPWYSEGYQPLGWRNFYLPGYWEDQGVKDLNGVVWFKKSIYLDKKWDRLPARLFMGRIVDADEVYLNGQKIGQTTYQYPQRRYFVPAGLLRAGENTFTIRVTNTGGKGGFVPDKPYYLFAGTDTVLLEGKWLYKVGQVIPPAAPLPGGIMAQNQPAALYNGMVAALHNLPVKGVVWYQGESNSAKPQSYAGLLKGMISDWRMNWQSPELPFIVVQLPGFMDYNYLPAESNWAQLRAAQATVLQMAKTGLVVALDLGEWNDIHPDNKKDVGERAALAALGVAYGEPIVYSGPVVSSAVRAGDSVVLRFDHIGSGLITNDGLPPQEFAIAGADKVFRWANARIEGNKVVLWHPDEKLPLLVRYGWADNPVNPNLANREGLPAAPFMVEVQ